MRERSYDKYAKHENKTPERGQILSYSTVVFQFVCSFVPPKAFDFSGLRCQFFMVKETPSAQIASLEASLVKSSGSSGVLGL